MNEGKETSEGQDTAGALGRNTAEIPNGEHDPDFVQHGLEPARSSRGKGLPEGGNLPSGIFGEEDSGMGRKVTDAMGPIVKKLLAYVGPMRLLLIVAAFMAVTGAVFAVTASEYLSDTTDRIERGFAGRMNIDEMWRLTLISVAIPVESFLFNFVEGLLIVRTIQWTARKMRSDLDRRIGRLPLTYFDGQSVGDALSRVSSDVDTLSQTLSNSAASIANGIITILGPVIMMFTTRWRMTLMGISAALIGVFGSGAIMGVSQKYFVAQQRQLGALSGRIEETCSGHPVVYALSAEGNVRQGFYERNDTLYTSAWKAQSLSSFMWPLIGFVGNFGYIVVCIVGAVSVLSGTVAVDVIVTSIAYIRTSANSLG